MTNQATVVGPRSHLVWQQRSVAKAACRRFFETAGYLEVDTPVLVPSPGCEAHMGYFQSCWKNLEGHSHPVYLRSSPEMQMKQVLSPSLPRIFQIGPSFRNGGEYTPWHHPEFLMLEWYEVALTLEGLMKQTETLIRRVAATLAPLQTDGGSVPQPTDSLIPSAAFQRFSVYELFEELTGIVLVDEDAGLARKARSKGLESIRSDDDFETAFTKILIDLIEPRLAREKTCILYDYPPSQAALARVVDGRALRFETYIDGIEISNGFDELCDGKENLRRLSETNQKRLQNGREALPIDRDFINAIGNGLPQCCGNALGLERLIAVLLRHHHHGQDLVNETVAEHNTVKLPDYLGTMLPFRHYGASGWNTDLLSYSKPN